MSNKRVLSQVDLGKYKKPNPYKNDILVDPRGQWDNPGQITRIPGNDITMQGVNYPVWAQPSAGPGTMMMPGQDYSFPGADYVDEYPQMKKGGMLKLPKMPKPGKNKKLGKGYSKSIEATNRLFTENTLFEKPKSKKRKVFDPNAKFQGGGATSPEEWEKQIRNVEGQIGDPSGWSLDDYNLLQNTLDQYRSWRENTPEGQAVIDSHNQEGEYDIQVPEHLQDYTNAVMKSRLAYANEFGNPAAKRMVNIPDNPYQFEDGNTGTHFMTSMDNYAVPQIQEKNNELVYGNYDPDSNEAIRFDNEADAQYFARNYKDVSPGFIEAELTPEEIQSYRDGGYVVEDISVPELTQAQKGITISDPKEYERRKAAYDDSLALYNLGEKNYNKRLNFNKQHGIPKSSIRKWNDPVEYKGDKLAKIQPIEGHGYVYNHNPNVVAKTNIAASLTNNKGFRYKKPVQPVYFAKPKPSSFSPIYVTNPLDPRLTAYDDSLRLYNNYATADANYKKRGDKKNAVTKPGRPGEYTYDLKEISPNVLVNQSEKNPDFHPTIKPTGRVSYDLKKPRVYKNGTINGVPFDGYSQSKDFINVFKKPVQPVYFKPKTDPAKKEYQYEKSRTIINNIPKTDPEGKIRVGSKEFSTFDEKTGKVVQVIDPIYEDITKLPARSINSLPQNTELAKIPVKPTPQKRNFVASGPRKTFTTNEWDPNKQEFVETKRQNKATNIGDGSASAEYLVDGKPISAEKLAELNAISARAKQRPQLTPAQMEEMQLMSTQFAYGGDIYQGGGQLGSGMLAQQIRQSKNAPKKPIELDNPRLGATKQSNQGNTATITPNNKLPKTLNTVRDPEAERKALEKQTRELVQSGAASRSLDTTGTSTKSLYEQTKDALVNDPNFLNTVQKNELAHQKELEQKHYDNASYLERGVNFGTAFMANPITTGANLLEGNRPFMQQAEILRNPNHPLYNSIGNTEGIANVFNAFNPGAYVADYSDNVKKGNYGEAAINAADILLAPTALGTLGDVTDLSKLNPAQLKSLLPQYKNVYRVEPTSFVKDAEDQLSGRWMGELDQMPFYVKNLKDPEAGVRIMRQKMPVKKWESMSGHNMPFNAKMMSAGTGDFKTLNNAVTAGELSPGAAKRLSVNAPIESDWEEINFNPRLINLSEGIVPEKLADKLRTQKPNRYFSSRDRVEYPAGELGRSGAIDHLLNVRQSVEKPILGIPRQYLPFAEGGEYVDAELTPDEIEWYKSNGYTIQDLD